METLNLASAMDIVGFADPASGKTSTPGCENAIVIVAQHPNGTAFAIAEWAERTSSNELNAKIFELNRRYRCRRFGAESSAQQNLWYEALVREAIARHERILLVPVEQPTNQTKEWRITTTIQEWMHNGLLYIADSCPALRHQLRVYPGGNLVDLADALASALRLLRNPLVKRRTATVEGPRS